MKVLVGMSGGVDSAVTALLLKQQGYEAVGVTFRLWQPTDENAAQSSCCSIDDVNDARLVCDKIGIPHYVFNYKDLFKEQVVDYFVEAYQKGETPNPCIACNRRIKFSAFLERAQSMGFDYIATGHYSKVIQNTDTGRYSLIKGAYDRKDQSYVLYSLTQEQLSKLLMPLGDYSKEEVRKIAVENGLGVSNKPDSQDICFVPNGDYTAFLEEYTGLTSPKGSFVDIHGKVLGAHKGLWNYTIGQRKGLGMTFGKPMFVADINPATGNVTLSEEDYLMRDTLYCSDINLIETETLTAPVRVTAKIRYAHKMAEATLYPLEQDRLKLVFDTPQRAITKGQAVVFYLGDKVFGGGTIE